MELTLGSEYYKFSMFNSILTEVRSFDVNRELEDQNYYTNAWRKAPDFFEERLGKILVYSAKVPAHKRIKELVFATCDFYYRHICYKPLYQHPAVIENPKLQFYTSTAVKQVKQLRAV